MNDRDRENSEDAGERRSGGFSISLFRVVTFLIVYTTALVSGVVWLSSSLYMNGLDSRLDRMALHYEEIFAKKADTISRTELDLRLEMVRQEIKRIDDKANDGRKAFEEYASAKNRPR